MANASDYLEFQIASHLFGSGTFSKPAVLALALCSGVMEDSQTGATIPEFPNANGYSRQTLNPSQTNWTDPVGVGGTVYNLSSITWGPATGDWGRASGVAICTSAAHGAGQVLVWGTLVSGRDIQEDDSFSIPVSGFPITIS